MACGAPVAAYPVTGPIDLVEEGVNSALDRNLETAIKQALQVPADSCRAFAEKHEWQKCADILRETLVPAYGEKASSLVASSE